MRAVGLVRGGTMNTVANSVGMARQSSERLLARLIADCASTNLERAERNVLRVTPEASGTIHYGFLFGTGVVHGFLAEYYRGGNPTPLAALTTLARAIATAFMAPPTTSPIAKPRP